MKDKILNVSVAENATSPFNKSIYVDDIYEIVEKVFKINPAIELGVMQRKGGLSKSWNIAVKDVDTHNRKNMDRFVGERYKLSSGCVINVSRAYEVFTDVVVKDIPPYWNTETVERIFQAYGRVNSVKQEEFRYSVRDCRAAYRNVWNGNWRINILIEKAIPSTLKIDGERIEVHYRGQPKTCFNCGDNHFFYERVCGRTHLNRFNMEDFPELIPRPVRDVNSEAQPDVEESNGEIEKVNETPIPIIEAPLAIQESKEPEIENQESKVKKTSKPEDMNKIEKAPLESNPQKPKPPKEILLESEGEKMDTIEKSQKSVENEVMVIEAEVMHRNDSQEVRGALPSPKVDDPIEEFISSVTLEDGKRLVHAHSDVYEFMVSNNSPEHTETGCTDTASDFDDLMKGTGSPSISLDSRPTPGQGNKVKSPNKDLMGTTQKMATQSGNLNNQLEEFLSGLPPPVHPESGTKRDRKEIQSTEEDSEYGLAKDFVNSNRLRKKLREGNGKQPEEDSDEHS